ncbi:MAG: YibE/F family protein [Ilumatobacteraceae bacterium]|nr:YibE/F family protein [Ilumatobacteraceae bacterium]
MARAIWSAVGVAAIATLIGVVVFWPNGASGRSTDPTLFSDPPLKAQVVGVTTAPCTGTTEADNTPCNFIHLHLDGQPRTPEPQVPRGGGGGESSVQNGPTIEQGVSDVGTLHAGDDIYVNMTVLPDGTATFSFYDYQRATPMWILAIAFIGAVLLLGRWRGLGAIAGLAASLVVIVKFLLPSILDGNSPVMVAIVASSLIAFVALYLAHGPTIPTSVALLGTFASLAVTAILSLLFVGWSHLTGLSDESALFLTSLGVKVNLQGIVLAGFVIGALGVLDDVTVTQVSAVWELRAAQPELAAGPLYRSAVSIGRDHISSTVNTLFLAYAGAALPLLLLFTQANQSVGSLAGREIVATEIIRSLVGSIGLVSAVPITTWLAVRALQPARREPAPAAAHLEA